MYFSFFDCYFFAAVNQVSLLGRTGGPPQKRGSEQHPVVIFSLATHTNYKYETGKQIILQIIIYNKEMEKLLNCLNDE